MGRLQQTDADHSWGVAMIILKLHPNPSRNLIAQAIVHDSGEKWAGDLSYPFKRMYPSIGQAHADAETQLAKDHNIPQFQLTANEVDWLRFADRLECHLFAEIYHPWVTKQPDWEKTKVQILEAAQKVGITQDIFEPAKNLFT
jgi:5'-deoxynucleotidase YfbR-like HD superfamily hydrolase